ncbi:tripartite tricarboxylate transporter TctB family protein [Desmospora activa]|uniref:Tripartite tricarboxylate transporter TctB family protein n=1 Tax=Desmospora activa DSM 45169 TaxID=1121389 RepID=A0A2T4ZC80_9BACL|nr:tripartite tricarboxylate transporter TctB family protein [Desmospora activa]PTM59493.1 tripartite tricarboxylate transporter TctB family protein [Desmospora activa DSM 45169]
MRGINSDGITAILLMLVASIALWHTRELNEMSAAFPRTVGWILVGLSIVYFSKSFWRPRGEKRFAAVDRRRVIIATVGIVFYGALIGLIGFLWASLLYLTFFACFLQKRELQLRLRLMRAVVFAFAVGGSFYLLFRYVFVVPLPNGVLFGS